MTARAKKKVVKKPKRPPFTAEEMHNGNVRMYDPVGMPWILTRDEALIFAIKLIRSSSGLSDAEIRQAFGSKR